MGDDTLTGNKTGRYELPLDDPDFLGELFRTAEEEGLAKTFQAGEWIFHAGEEPEEYWLIGKGRVAQYRGGSDTGSCINELGPRRFLGVRAFHLGMPHTTSAQAIEPSTLIRIGGSLYGKLLKVPRFVYLVIQQQEKEICEVSDAVLRSRVDLEALQREVATLRRDIERYEKMSPEQLAQRNVRAGVAERTLHLLAPDLVGLDKDVAELLATLPPEVLKAVRNNLVFGRIFAAITRCRNQVRPLEFTRK
ncbi:cyclic nucleotide-binding domain-containing protein [Candidatus Falkowbacteria bacterium]|nr:cyclic nucleotide-binding domain-containing protein [Candidatus Falkowbacteria bacterium]